MRALLSGSDSVTPVSGFAALMCNGEDLRTIHVIFLVHHSVGKAIEVADAKAIFAVRPTFLILDKKIAHALILCKESQRNHAAGVGGVVLGCVAELSLGVGVNRLAHAILARTRTKASSPGTIATLPLRTSSRRRRARFIQAFWEFDFGSKLAISNSRIRARSSAGRSRTSAARSWAGVVMMPPGWCLGVSMPYLQGSHLAAPSADATCDAHVRWQERAACAAGLLMPTTDAGYTTAGASPTAKLSVSFSPLRGSPYTTG